LKMTGELYQWKVKGLKLKVKRKSPEPVGFGTLNFFLLVSSRGRCTGRTRSGGGLGGCGLEGGLHGRDYTRENQPSTTLFSIAIITSLARDPNFFLTISR